LAPIRYLTYQEHYDFYVVEMGIDSPDTPQNMAYLLSIVRPHVGLVLNATLAHSANFDRLVKDKSPSRRLTKLIDLISQEKLNLARGVEPGGVAVFNLDQKEFARDRKTIQARQLTFGKSAAADLRILPKHRVSYQGQKYQFNLPAHSTGAIAAACALGIPPTISLQALQGFPVPAGRGRIFVGLSDSTIIDSSYNASPQSMLASLNQLAKRSGKHNKIAVLGDMRELGISEKIAHKNLADWIIKYCDEAILFGPLTARYTTPVLESRHFPVNHFKTMSELTKYLRESLPLKSFVLVKGSQNGLYMERAVESILSDPQDISKLCRRGPYWDKIRASMV
jgi:UDP-N-acetylmuramoyl-tripeptide--D-alanyl-D-alanine ligase